MVTTHPANGHHPNVQVLRALYADLSSIGRYTTDDVVLHRADRTVENPQPIVGRDEVIAHETAFVEVTNGTLVMDVEHIASNDNFGAVFGVIRLKQPRPTVMPFCGLWRFENGKIAEHWENAYDPPALLQVLTEPASPS
ncbi:hypothetical protein CFN78_16585 [Amycolatopsis antarctica]|uniref:SnoaL-like domain-containing protein n=1 Tax=Amycolatopsis antarctica TaxID=1854586 RepID=A0A263D1C6_9PSEU|nr:nuclear transport factor 2 family protein [Amycolatopsis antarctica]OZM72151.1 hypothetical protein CFN78_16585 [Amycolatopsis antarctica]